MTTFTVSAMNNSMNRGSFMIFQKPQNFSQGNVFSLAWMARMCSPQTNTAFNWKQDYAFSWSQTGQLVPGVRFTASQMIPADPKNQNSIRLDYNGSFSFQDPNPGGSSGTLTVQDSASIPMNKAAVGIAMSGSTIYASQAQPNTNQIFTAQPNYWIAFGNYQEGEVLDISRIWNTAALNFPPGVTRINVTLNQDNTFTIQYA